MQLGERRSAKSTRSAGCGARGGCSECSGTAATSTDGSMRCSHATAAVGGVSLVLRICDARDGVPPGGPGVELRPRGAGEGIECWVCPGGAVVARNPVNLPGSGGGVALDARPVFEFLNGEAD